MGALLGGTNFEEVGHRKGIMGRSESATIGFTALVGSQLDPAVALLQLFKTALWTEKMSSSPSSSSLSTIGGQKGRKREERKFSPRSGRLYIDRLCEIGGSVSSVNPWEVRLESTAGDISFWCT